MDSDSTEVTGFARLSQILWLTAELTIIFVTIKVITTVVYRVNFHPLSKYPGPWLAKITDLYGAYYSAKGQTHTYIYHAHQHYGAVVRLGPNKLGFKSSIAFNDLYASKSVQKSAGYPAMAIESGALNTHTLIDKTLHRRKRRLVSQAFSDQALRGFEPLMVEQINIFLKEMSKITSQTNNETWSGPIDLGRRFKHLTLDVLTELGFGQSLKLQISDENRFFIDAIDAATFRCGIYAQYAKLRKYGLDIFFIGFQKTLWTRFVKLNEALVKSRLEQSSNEKADIFSLLIDAKDPETNETPSASELFAESALFVIAGTDTTATALSATLFYLSRHRTCYSRLVRLVRDNFSSVASIKSSNPELTNLLYLRSSIDEAMRMSPPIGQALWREVSDPGGTFVDGIFVPKGIDIGASIYCVHHNENIFSESFKYRPERWMPEEGNSPEKIEAMKHAFQPFSVGPRKCIAMSMAYAELMMVIARVLWIFDIQLIEGEEEELFELKEHLTSHFSGPKLQIKHRAGIEKELEKL